MRKLNFLILMCLFAISVKAQVGINTNEPKATLDVVGEPETVESLDGVIPPRITGEQLHAKTYTTEQTGAVVYATEAASSTTNLQTQYVTEPGLYYFDGSVWKSATQSNDIKTEKAGKCIVSSPTRNFANNSDNGTQITVGDYNFRWYWVNGSDGSIQNYLQMKKINSTIPTVDVITKPSGGSTDFAQESFIEINSDTDWVRVSDPINRQTDNMGEILLFTETPGFFKVIAGGIRNGNKDETQFCLFVEQIQ